MMLSHPFFLCFRVSEDSNFAEKVAGVLVESGTQLQNGLSGNCLNQFCEV